MRSKHQKKSKIERLKNQVIEKFKDLSSSRRGADRFAIVFAEQGFNIRHYTRMPRLSKQERLVRKTFVTLIYAL